MALYGIPQCTDKKTALSAAIAYWVFRCRDRKRSPANGVDTWTFFQSALINSVQGAAKVEHFIENLCRSLNVPHLRPQEWSFIVSPNQTILRLNRETGEMLQLDADQTNEKLQFESWRSIINSLASEGITDESIIETIENLPHIIIAYVRVRFEEDRAIGQDAVEDNAIEVESYEV